jgi:hypothetical protein
MTRAWWMMAVLLAAAGSILMVGTGCETDSAHDRLRLSPESAVLSKGQSQEFVVSGGYTYTWSLASPEHGRLSARTGDRTVYTSTYTPATNAVTQRVMTVTSTIEGSAASSTNAAAYSVSAEAIVTHK